MIMRCDKGLSYNQKPGRAVTVQLLVASVAKRGSISSYMYSCCTRRGLIVGGYQLVLMGAQPRLVLFSVNWNAMHDSLKVINGFR